MAKDNISIITIKQQFLHTEASVTDAMRSFSTLHERVAVYSYVNLMTIQTCTVWSKLNVSNTINIQHSQQKSLATTCTAQTHATQAREISQERAIKTKIIPQGKKQNKSDTITSENL